MANLMGFGLGTARGGVPLARIAVYKVCWSDGCPDADILKAFDDAIAEGVDIISLSVVGQQATDFFRDVFAIGAFHAMKNGILTSHAAGNTGPTTGTILSVSPWSLSVAASTIDRKFFTKVLLGNNMTYTGVSINTFGLHQMFPLIYAGDAPNTRAGFKGSQSRLCINNSLDETLVKGKIILCGVPTTGEQERLAGAVGSIQGDGYTDVAFSQPLPASLMGVNEGNNIYNYIRSTSNPTAIIMRSTEGKDEFAPYVASISSRGPNPITRDILKPDIAAPGIDILAAWSPLSSVSGSTEDNRTTTYNIISGTSMACPHVTGAAAYIKSYHPTWSPSAIKSALMTTAYSMSPKNNSDAEFAYGAGHINPIKAVNPGLIYDANEVDYVNFLCGQGYRGKFLKLVTGDNSICSESTKTTAWDLNYPSFAFYTPPLKSFTTIFHRTVTNVGTPVSIYKANVTAPTGLKILVEPSILTFKSLGQRLSFAVTVEGRIQGANTRISASLVWYDGVYQVRSPIVVYS
ncbi:hypothetical protein F0562_022134 [Nyssa sinensis]|uniref:Subtilisin-like protease fibronectin type-III domain-containing protein n=1 Tax=Nyssa sinensis TaxID=561372 RepID=A0A5J5BQX8_9ASTE|nr:hypothetical protein F0562_022134 [Nyssa sinensis]